MANLLNQAAVFLESQRVKVMTEPVTYQRGINTAVVQATCGKTNFTIDDEAGFTVGSHVVDFIVAVSEMKFGETAILPRLGDVIITADQSQYEVVYLASDGCWRYSDGFALSMRIHTKPKLS